MFSISEDASPNLTMEDLNQPESPPSLIRPRIEFRPIDPEPTECNQELVPTVEKESNVPHIRQKLDQSPTIVRIKNLDYSVTQSELQKLFEPLGGLKKVVINQDRHGRSLGTGEAFFLNESDALYVIKKFHNYRLHGRLMKLFNLNESRNHYLRKSYKNRNTYYPKFNSRYRRREERNYPYRPRKSYRNLHRSRNYYNRR